MVCWILACMDCHWHDWLGPLHGLANIKHVRVCQRGWAGRPRARNPKPLTSIGPKPLTFIDRPGQPGLLIPHFHRQAPASPAPNPSLLSTEPRPARPPTSIGQTLRFYWPDPSLLSARPGRAVPDRVGPCRAVSGRVGTRAGPCPANRGRVAMSA